MAINIALPDLRKKKNFIYINAAESGVEKKIWTYRADGNIWRRAEFTLWSLIKIINFSFSLISLLSYSDSSVKLH